MIEIIAKEQGGTQRTSLDVQETPVEFNYKVADLADITAKRSPHSLRFNMPRTKKNDGFFTHFYDVNFTSNTFSPQVKTEVEVFDNGIVILNGILQLHAVDEKIFEVSVLGEVADFFEKIRDLSFQDLFINDDGTLDTDLDHALNKTNIINSWVLTNDITSGAVGAGVVVYPLSDTAEPWEETGDKGFIYYFSGGTPIGMGNGETAIVPTSQKPAIQIKWLFERIGRKAGFTIESAFFETDQFKKIYMTLATEQGQTILRPTYGAKVGLVDDLVLDPWVFIHTLPFSNESQPNFYDPDGLFNNGAFTPLATGTYTFHIRLMFEMSTPASGSTYDINVHAVEQFGNFDVHSGVSMNVEYGEQAQYNTTLTIDVSESQEIIFGVTCSATSAVLTIYETLYSAIHPSFIELVNYTTTGGVVNMRENFPKMKVGEWVKEIVARFNLVLLTEAKNITGLKIEPWGDFVDANTSFKDWSKKVDIDTIKIEPTTQSQKKRILFSDGEGEDWRNAWWQDNEGWVKGQALYVNSNPDFVTGTEEIGGKFQPLRLSTIPSSVYDAETYIPNVLVQRFYAHEIGEYGEKQQVSTKPMLSYYHGKKDIGNNALFLFGLPDSAQYISQYPFFSEFSETPVEDETLSLSWGYDYPDNVGSLYIGAGISLNQCFQTYWARFMHTLYSQDSRVLTCKAYLTPQDIAELKWNGEVFVENTWWRVLEVNNYATGGNELCNLKLIKVLQSGEYNSTDFCTARPYQSNTNGTISFMDNITGVVSTPTRACCEQYGYVWDEDDGVCFYKVHGGGGSGVGGGGTGGGHGMNEVGVGIDPLLQSQSPISNTQAVKGAVIGALPTSVASGIREQGINGSVQNFKMYLKTTDAVYTSAKKQGASSEIPIAFNSIYLVTVNVVTVETGGTSGVLGRAMSMTYQASVGNVDDIAKNIGTTTLINSQGEASTSRTVAIEQKQTTDNPPIFKVLCSGETDKDISWILDVNLLQISLNSDTLVLPAYWNLVDEIIWLNIASNDFLTFNIE